MGYRYTFFLFVLYSFDMFEFTDIFKIGFHTTAFFYSIMVNIKTILIYSRTKALSLSKKGIEQLGLYYKGVE